MSGRSCWFCWKAPGRVRVIYRPAPGYRGWLTFCPACAADPVARQQGAKHAERVTHEREEVRRVIGK